MKKLFLVAAVAGLGLFATSCKKECKCTAANGASVTAPGDQDGNLDKEKCEALTTPLLGITCKWQ
jgi:hypothetical protein